MFVGYIWIKYASKAVSHLAVLPPTRISIPPSLFVGIDMTDSVTERQFKSTLIHVGTIFIGPIFTENDQ